MTEAEWDKLRWLENAYAHLDPRRYDRKLRLFTVACLRLNWFQIPDAQCRKIVELSELFADDHSAYGELIATIESLEEMPWPWEPQIRIALYAAVVRSASYEDSARRYRSSMADLLDYRTRMKGPFDHPILEAEAKWHEQYAFLNLLRDIVGNPFRPVVFDPRWRSETAVALASGIYAERAFDRMPILADALEEAGCDHADVLHHCRDPHQPHARGCGVVDLVLGKS